MKPKVAPAWVARTHISPVPFEAPRATHVSYRIQVLRERAAGQETATIVSRPVQ